MTSNFIRHYNDYEKDGELINLASIKRIYKKEDNDGILIILVFITSSIGNTGYTQFVFDTIIERDSYFNQLEQYLTLEINI